MLCQVCDSVAGVQLQCSGSLEFCALKKDASHVWNFKLITVSVSFLSSASSLVILSIHVFCTSVLLSVIRSNLSLAMLSHGLHSSAELL